MNKTMEKDNRFDYEAPNIYVVKLSMKQALLNYSGEDSEPGQGAWSDDNN